MIDKNTFDVIIVGGSYSSLAAAMALGRALKKVLIIDDGKPCNKQTPFSHNFITNDGKTPVEITALANLQVRRYNTVKFFEGTAKSGNKTDDGFEIQVESGETFAAKQLIFATGIKDKLAAIDGFAACWGISVIHCPYCHGYEVRGKPTGILGNGEMAFDFTRLISNWTTDLRLFTNGTSYLTSVQRDKLLTHGIEIVEKRIEKFEHDNGYIKSLLFKDGTKFHINAIYAPSSFEQHCTIPEALGCELTEDGYIRIDTFQGTTVDGIYACGDNAGRMRTVANAVAMGTAAGIIVSKRVILNQF